MSSTTTPSESSEPKKKPLPKLAKPKVSTPKAEPTMTAPSAPKKRVTSTTRQDQNKHEAEHKPMKVTRESVTPTQTEKNRNKNNGGNRNNNSKKNKKKGQYKVQDKPRNSEQQHSKLLILEPVGEPEEVEGLMEMTAKGFAFLRTAETDFAFLQDAIYISPELVRKYQLRHCAWIQGKAQRYTKGIQLINIHAVNGISPEAAIKLPYFEDLKAINPTKRLPFETVPERFTTRTVDLITPIARGQRGLIVSPPRSGKTTILQHIAEAAIEKYKDSLELMVLLIDERPEEVTEFKRSLKGAEIYASSNDGQVRDHCRIAEICIERAKRQVEAGKHVLILMDSITRLTRAYNNADAGSGRTMSGGIDARALETPRRLFAAARNTREAGSLTIIATALIETNSRMDDLIFQEFKGTGNMELVLNRRIAEQYIYPAIDILRSGTRREELIFPEHMLEKIHLIRRALAGHKPPEAMERFLFFLKKYPNNAQMIMDLKQRT